MNGNGWRTLALGLVSAMLGMAVSTASFWASMRDRMISQAQVVALIRAEVNDASFSYERDRQLIKASIDHCTEEVRRLRADMEAIKIEQAKIVGRIEGGFK